MQNNQRILLASAIVLITGGLWGFYWLPVRTLVAGADSCRLDVGDRPP